MVTTRSAHHGTAGGGGSGWWRGSTVPPCPLPLLAIVIHDSLAVPTLIVWETQAVTTTGCGRREQTPQAHERRATHTESQEKGPRGHTHGTYHAHQVTSKLQQCMHSSTMQVRGELCPATGGTASTRAFLKPTRGEELKKTHPWPERRRNAPFTGGETPSQTPRLVNHNFTMLSRRS